MKSSLRFRGYFFINRVFQRPRGEISNVAQVWIWSKAKEIFFFQPTIQEVLRQMTESGKPLFQIGFSSLPDDERKLWTIHYSKKMKGQSIEKAIRKLDWNLVERFLAKFRSKSLFQKNPAL